ncbi:hypothetical protein HDU98_007846 [Podochytrium sp. JEL0797]|nr:hypothetical protein HDU98_007846 [Podochytrium sp. JEL0797]
MRLLDLCDHYNKDLLDRFYGNLMVPAFGMFPDELEDVATLHDNLSHTNGSPDAEYILHVILALDGERILGGVCCEYYKSSFLDRGIGKALVDHAMAAMSREAVAHGVSIAAVFLETNSDAVDSSLDSMLPSKRRLVLQGLGFRFLDFEYVQPRLSESTKPCETLHLCVHESFVSVEGHTISANTLASFVRNFYTVLQGSESVISDAFALKQLNWLAERDVVEVHEHVIQK